MTKTSDGRYLSDSVAATKTGVLMTPAGVPGKWTAVTASDSTDLTGCIGILVLGTGLGNVAARFVDAPSTTITFTGVPPGLLIPGAFSRVMAATTATNIMACWP